MKKPSAPKATWSKAIRAFLAWLKDRRMRKASHKWKKVIMQVEASVSIQKRRRLTIINQSRADIAQLLHHGTLPHALSSRVEQLYKDECQVAAYDQIENYCECIITNVADICEHSCVENLPVKVREAIASVICAGSRCGELQQLLVIRRLLRKKYGSQFDAENVELRAGNFVNSELKQNLCVKVVPENEKLRLIDELIAHQEYNMDLRLRESKATRDGYIISSFQSHVNN